MHKVPMIIGNARDIRRHLYLFHRFDKIDFLISHKINRDDIEDLPPSLKIATKKYG
jgi:hypothetical protein